MATTISYKLTPEHLSEGIAAANERIYGKLIASKRWYWDALRGFLLTFVPLCLLFAILRAVEFFIGRSLDIAAVLVGLAYGTSFILLLGLWSAVVRRRNSPYSLKGPTLAQQTASFNDDGLVIAGPNFLYRYEWSNFEEVTLGASVLLLWTEPGVVIVMPREAIGGLAAETALLDDIRRNIAASARAGNAD